MQSKSLRFFIRISFGDGDLLLHFYLTCVLVYGQKKVCIECNGYGSSGSRSGHDNDHQ